MKFLSAVALTTALLIFQPPALAQPPIELLIEDISVRDQLISDQENLLNTYRCLFGVDTGVVPGGCPTPDVIEPGSPPENPTLEDMFARDSLIQAQEELLNAYRCRFSVDLELVSEGCVVNGMVQAVCPDSYSNAGTEFQYDPNDFQGEYPHDTAVEHFCGEWCGEFCSTGTGTLVCPSDTMNRGETVNFSITGGFGEGDARRLYCGLTADEINAQCEVIDDATTRAILRDSPNVRDDCFIMGVYVRQFDDLTGPCRILGSFSRFEDAGFNSSALSLFEFTVPGLPLPTCPALADAEQGGNIVVAATYRSTYTYQSTGSSTNTVPYFKLEGISR